MGQRQKTQNFSQDVDTSDLETEFDKVQKTPTTREVILEYSSCCGCGCTDVKIKRVVDYNSPLQNGDRINNLLNTDEWI